MFHSASEDRKNSFVFPEEFLQPRKRKIDLYTNKKHVAVSFVPEVQFQNKASRRVAAYYI